MQCAKGVGDVSRAHLCGVLVPCNRPQALPSGVVPRLDELPCPSVELGATLLKGGGSDAAFWFRQFNDSAPLPWRSDGGVWRVACGVLCVVCCVLLCCVFHVVLSVVGAGQFSHLWEKARGKWSDWAGKGPPCLGAPCTAHSASAASKVMTSSNSRHHCRTSGWEPLDGFAIAASLDSCSRRLNPVLAL